MLLPFRWLLYGTAATAAQSSGTRKHPKIQRKLRRLAQWSEAIAPPRIAVTISGEAIPPLHPSVASGTLRITRHVAVYNKGPIATLASLADFTGVDVSIDTAPLEIKSVLVSGEIDSAIDLFQEEYLMLLAA